MSRSSDSQDIISTMRTVFRLTFVQFIICVIASIGFAFDIYELLMLPLIVRPALLDLAGVMPGTPQFEQWVGLLFFVPAVVGGLFGLLGGFLTDLLGRRRVLVGSILLYAFSACAAGFATSIITTLLFACSYGAAFGALQHTPRMVLLLPEVQQRTDGKPAVEQRKIEQQVAAEVNAWQEFGGLAGRLLLACLAVWIVSRRVLLRLFLIPGLVLIPLVFIFPARESLDVLKLGIFAAGLLTVGQFSFWGNYLPRVYPLHLRGTGEGFAANIGGRILGTSFALLTTWLTRWMPEHSLALAAAAVAILVYSIGFLLSFWLPEPRHPSLPT